MDSLIEQPVSSRAAAASSRAKRAILVVCALLAAGTYVSGERQRAAASPDGRNAYRELHGLAGSALRFDEPAALNVRKLFYDKRDRVYCGEVNGHGGKPADGVRIFVCAPDARAAAGG